MVKKKEQNKKIIILIIILVGIFLLNIILPKNKKVNNKITDENNMAEEIEQKNEEESRMDRLQNMSERDRMEFYFGIFLEYVESGKYEKAYDLLYSEFKESYFPTLESFVEYMQKTFTEMTNIEHSNIERNGDVYVLWINITDALNGSPKDKKEMNIVIRENDYNDFEMSFSVINE